MDSDIPTQSVGKKSQLGDLHLAFVPDKEVVKEHGQRWQPGMKAKIDTRPGWIPGHPSWWTAGARRCLVRWRKSATRFRDRG